MGKKVTVLLSKSQSVILSSKALLPKTKNFDVVRAASAQETVADMYVASVMMVDADSFMEKSYLDELARG